MHYWNGPIIALLLQTFGHRPSQSEMIMSWPPQKWTINGYIDIRKGHLLFCGLQCFTFVKSFTLFIFCIVFSLLIPTFLQMLLCKSLYSPKESRDNYQTTNECNSFSMLARRVNSSNSWSGVDNEELNFSFLFKFCPFLMELNSIVNNQTAYLDL